MNWSWFGVKTIYRIEAFGRPQAIDSAYDPDATLIEERVVLFRARSFDEAIRKAEKEALRYAASQHRNPYGQTVKMRYLEACNAFLLYELPGVGVEVYSATEVVNKQIHDDEILDRKLGKQRGNDDRQQRLKFLHHELAGAVKKIADHN